MFVCVCVRACVRARVCVRACAYEMPIGFCCTLAGRCTGDSSFEESCSDSWGGGGGGEGGGGEGEGEGAGER